ncbi:TRAP transporter substrate-binding protein [Marinomonas pontica]|uniref:TRAP transporter substrate-binding protein n=1 Tax=Marinomonas pontica TaxID=264739 RepID=UPI0022445012|nr:TRAP transporter substrate-binding protein [Marinomonas pontica]MCW8356406.1 TRAP transporter substrate-binding protein [Marinomonas pontica]
MKMKSVMLTILSGMLATSAAYADVHKLRLGHFWPAGSSVDQVITDWANKVKTDSNGEIAIDIYPSQTLAKAAQSYSATVKGILDITVTAQGYMAGRFPLTQIIELPGIVTNAENTSCVLQTLFDDESIASEYKDSHPLFFFAHGPGHIHTNGKNIAAPEDLNGMRIRRATTVVANILSSLGAQPVGMPAPETYTAAQRNIIDGVAFPWQAMKDFRLNEQLTSHTEMALYTLSFITTMNTRSYKALPAHLQKVIDDNSGMEWARTMGKKLDDLDTAGRTQAIAEGHSISNIDNIMENPAWKPVLSMVVDDYLTSVSKPNLNAKNIYENALSYKKSCAI